MSSKCLVTSRGGWVGHGPTNEPLSRVPGSLNRTYCYGVNYMYGTRHRQDSAYRSEATKGTILETLLFIGMQSIALISKGYVRIGISGLQAPD
jgi:hypothetical protein